MPTATKIIYNVKTKQQEIRGLLQQSDHKALQFSEG